MIRQERVQFGVMRSVRARDIERGLHRIREPSIERRGFSFFEHVDLQWRVMGREDVDSDEAGGLPVRNIKRGL